MAHAALVGSAVYELFDFQGPTLFSGSFERQTVPFVILDNIDVSRPAAIEAIDVSTSTTSELKLNVLLWMGAGLFALMIGGLWTVHSALNASIESQRQETKADFARVTDSMVSQFEKSDTKLDAIGMKLDTVSTSLHKEVANLRVRQTQIEATQ